MSEKRIEQSNPNLRIGCSAGVPIMEELRSRMEAEGVDYYEL